MLDKQTYQNYLSEQAYAEKTKLQYLRLYDAYKERYEELTKENLRTFFNSFKNTHLNRAFLRTIVEAYDEPIEMINFIARKVRGRYLKGLRKNKQYKFLTPDAVKHICENVEQDLAIKIRLMYETGLRVSELLNLKHSDIFMNNYEFYVEGKGKGNKPFQIWFSSDLAVLLMDYLAPRQEQEYPFRLNKDIKHQDHALWFLIKTRGEKLGFKLHPHMFRHSFGHYLRVYEKLDLIQIKELMRHDNINTTQIYANATREEAEELMKKQLFRKVF